MLYIYCNIIWQWKRGKKPNSSNYSQTEDKAVMDSPWQKKENFRNHWLEIATSCLLEEGVETFTIPLPQKTSHESTSFVLFHRESNCYLLSSQKATTLRRHQFGALYEPKLWEGTMKLSRTEILNKATSFILLPLLRARWWKSWRRHSTSPQ